MLGNTLSLEPAASYWQYGGSCNSIELEIQDFSNSFCLLPLTWWENADIALERETEGDLLLSDIGQVCLCEAFYLLNIDAHL
jgi:hypothetical protein